MDRMLSPCHEESLFGSLNEGVLTGSCKVCDEDIVRTNPHTGLLEWLDGNPPWTTRMLWPLPFEFQKPETLAFLPAFRLVSPCHNLPVRYLDYVKPIRVGICTKCNSIFARVNPLTGRVERVDDELAVDITDLAARLPEFPEEFQPIQFK